MEDVLHLTSRICVLSNFAGLRASFRWTWLTGLKFLLGFIWAISALFPRWEKVKDPGDQFWRQIRETKHTWRNTKILTLGPIIVSVTLKAASLQLNGGCLWSEKYKRQWKTIPSQTARIHPAVLPCNRKHFERHFYEWQEHRPWEIDVDLLFATTDRFWRQFPLNFLGKLCPLRLFIICTLIDHSSRPISVQEIARLF